MANKINFARCRFLTALISVTTLACSISTSGGQGPDKSRIDAMLSNKTRQESIDLAESLLRPQVAVQIYTAPTTVDSNQTISSSNYTNQKLTSSETSRVVLKKIRDREPTSRQNSDLYRDYQTASSKPMRTWQYDTNDAQLQPNAVDLHQLDGNTFTLAGPMINAVITVPSLSSSSKVADQRMSASSTTTDGQDEQLFRNHEEELARNISATSVERAIAYLLNNQASGNVEFNMNMNGDEIIINPVGRAVSLLSTSLPAIIGNQDNQLDRGETMIRQYSHNSLLDTDDPNQVERTSDRSRVSKRFSRLIKGDRENNYRLRSDERPSPSPLATTAHKGPVSMDNIETNDYVNNNTDYSGDDEDDDQMNSSLAKRNDDDESDFENEPSTAKTKQVEVVKKFRTTSGQSIRGSSAHNSDMKDADRSKFYDGVESSESPPERFRRAGGKNIDGGRTTGEETGDSLRRPLKKRRTHQQGRGNLVDNGSKSSAERTSSSIYSGSHKAPRRSQPATAKIDNNQSPSLVIKGEDLKRFEQLLESLRSLSMVNMGVPRFKAKPAKSSRTDELRQDADELTKPAAAHRHLKHRDPAASKRNHREQRPSPEPPYDETDCNKSVRNRSQLQSEDSQPENDPDSSSSHNKERNEGSQSTSNDNYEDRKRTSDSDDENNDESTSEKSGAQSSENLKNDDDMSFDESETNLSQRKANIVKQSGSDMQSLPDALYVRKTILHSYYDRHQPGVDHEFVSGSESERQPEFPGSSTASEERHEAQRNDDKTEADYRNQEESKQKHSDIDRELNSPKSSQQEADTRDTNTYIDYNRLDDREVYRGSESQKFKMSVPVMRSGGPTVGGQSAMQARASDIKIPYARALTSEDNSMRPSNGWSAVVVKGQNTKDHDDKMNH